MAQFLAGFFFSLATIMTLTMIVAMLRGEWARVTAILSGRELQAARNAPQVRVRLRGWPRPEQRRILPLRAVA